MCVYQALASSSIDGDWTAQKKRFYEQNHCHDCHDISISSTILRTTFSRVALTTYFIWRGLYKAIFSSFVHLREQHPNCCSYGWAFVKRIEILYFSVGGAIHGFGDRSIRDE